MRLPPTNNAEEIWAFKKGYRFAQQGKPLREMPFNVRAQRNLKAMFEQGYAQGEADYARRSQTGPQLTPQKRALWLVLTLLAGLGTAKLMIDDMQAPTERANPRPATPLAQASPAPTTTQTLAPAAAPNSVPQKSEIIQSVKAPQTTQPASSTQIPQQKHARLASLPPALKPQAPQQAPAQTRESQDFSLLDAEARAKYLAPQQTVVLPPIIDHTTIKIPTAVLAANVVARKPVGIFKATVPPGVRKLYFFTRVQGAQGHTIRHRWRYGTQVLAEIPLKITSNDFRTWSSKRMSPAWRGQWWVEVVDEKDQIITRKGFQYAPKQIYKTPPHFTHSDP